jgi:hypothetical protein
MKNGHPESLARNALEMLADVFSRHSGASRSDEPGTHAHGPRKARSDAATPSAKPVFMGSGFGPAGRLGMTRAISGQALRMKSFLDAI